MRRFNTTDRIGVNRVESIFLSELEWIPRDILQSDMGIDMIVEIAEEGKPTGQYIAIQIKSGESYFKEQKDKKVIYRGSNEHLDYWLSHSIPVIIVLHNQTNDKTIWEVIKKDKIKKTEKGWKIGIPLEKNLDSKSKKELIESNKLPIYLQRFQRLAADKFLIDYVQEGNMLVLEIEEWVNKMDGRAIIKILKNIDSEDILISRTNILHFYSPETLNLLFPWASFEVDEQYYEKEEEDDFLANYGIWDSEDKCYIGFTEEYYEYRDRLPKIRGIDDGSGEIRNYRLIFSLNEIAESFLKVDHYLNYGLQLKLDLGK